MTIETVHTTQSRQPGKHEFKEEIKVETADGVRVETTHEVKQQIKPEPVLTDPYSRVSRAEALIQRNVLWALGAGVMPIPIVDVVAVSGVQVKMLKELSDLYGTKFTTSIAKKIVGSLLSGVGSVGLGGVIGASLAKLVPVVGTTLGVVSVPILAGAFTHATGRIFLMHFESGGTVLDFDPHAMRSHFQREFEKAKEIVSRLHREEGKEAGAKTT